MAKSEGNSKKTGGKKSGNGPGKKSRPSPIPPPATDPATSAPPPSGDPGPAATEQPATSGGIDWKRMHLWQIQPLRDVLLIALIIGLIYLGYVLSIVTVPILLAMLLAYLFEPVVRALLARFHRMTRTQAVSLILAIGIIVPVSIFTVGVSLAVVQAVGLARSVTDNVGIVLAYAGDVRRFEQRRLQPVMLELYEAQQAPDAQEDSARIDELRETLEAEEFYDAYLRRVGQMEAEAEAQPPEDAATASETPAGAEAAPPETGEGNDATEEKSPSRKTGDEDEEEEQEPFAWRPFMSDAYLNLPPDGWWRRVAEYSGDLFQTIGEVDFVARVNTSVRDRISPERIGEMREVTPVVGDVLSAGGGILSAGAAVLGVFASIFAFGFMVFLTCFFYFFIATGYPSVTRFGGRLLPEKHKPRILDLLAQMDRVVAGFVRGRLTICVIQSIFFAIGYSIIGTPGALVLGIVVGVLSIVPYLALVGIPASIMLMLLDPPGDPLRSHWLWIMLAPPAIYFLGQAMDDYILTPRIQGKTTNMDTPTILFASLAGGTLLGIYGLLLAIPLAACIKILLREVFWPGFKAWTEGEERDFLPISRE